MKNSFIWPFYFLISFKWNSNILQSPQILGSNFQIPVYICRPFEKLNVKKTSLSEGDLQKFSGQKMPQRIQKIAFCPLEIIKTTL
jgi:hypothetical protein